jgi:DNA-binding response OmpR family regulator
MSRGTILFLEENAEQQALVSAYLSERGYEVEPARTVKEARTVLACIRVDAAVVDGLLPGVGTGFLQELRQQHPRVPILLASDFWKDPSSHEHLTRQLDVPRVLHKPYTPYELLLWVERLLEVRPAPAPPAALAGGQGSSDDLDDTFRALSAEYATRLEEKLRELTGAMERARAGSAEALEEAHQLAHKLHGTAGSYGFHAVSGAARTLETLLRRSRDGREAPDWSALEAARQELAVAARR